MSTQFNEADHPRSGGGKFAEKIQSEAEGIALGVPAAKPKPIMASVTLQEWREDDEDIADTVAHIEFDAAPVLAGIVPGLSPYQLSDMSPEICDQVFEEAVSRGLVPNHDGPFEVDVQNALDEALAENPAYFSTPYPHHLAVRHPDAVLQTPLNPYELGSRIDEHDRVEGQYAIGMDELVGTSLDEHHDNLGTTLTGSPLVMDTSAEPVAVVNGEVIFRISGNISQVIETMDDDDREAFEEARAARA